MRLRLVDVWLVAEEFAGSGDTRGDCFVALALVALALVDVVELLVEESREARELSCV